MVKYKLRTVGLTEKQARDLNKPKKNKRRRVYLKGKPKEAPKKKVKKYDDTLREKVIMLFNRTKLGLGEESIDNSDQFIADKLDVPKTRVAYIITHYLKAKWEKLK